MQQIKQSIDRYLAAMGSADRATPEIAEAKAEWLKEKIETLKQQMQSSSKSRHSFTRVQTSKSPSTILTHAQWPQAVKAPERSAKMYK